MKAYIRAVRDLLREDVRSDLTIGKALALFYGAWGVGFVTGLTPWLTK